MKILNRYNKYSLLPLNFSECGYLTHLIQFLDKELTDDYSLQIIYPGAKLFFDNISKYNIAIHISNEVNFNNEFYDYFDFVFRFYLEKKCDYKKIFPINIGYNSNGYENINLKFNNSIDLIKRNTDVFFYGNRNVRKHFFNKLKYFTHTYDINFSNSYRGGLSLLSYREKLSNTKICLTPGGASPETFRYTEAFASGCIVFTDFYSDVWYMKNSPSIYINNWNDFSNEYIKDILDHAHIGDYKERGIDYYNSYLSPKANAYYILKILSN